LLGGDEKKTFSSCVGRLLYLASYRHDIQWVLGDLCSLLQKPTCLAWRKLKHLTRYLVGTRDMCLNFPVDPAMREISVYVDADWAKGPERRSVSSGQVQVGGCVLMAWSRKQTIVAQSSAESEFYAILTGANEGVAVASLLSEVGISLPVVVYTDSSSGKAICLRLGAGSQKHVETRYFHIQSMVRNKRLTIEKVAGEWNPADIGTKPVPKKALERLLPLSGLVQFGGPTISAVTTTTSSSSIGNVPLLAFITFLQTLCVVKGESLVVAYQEHEVEELTPARSNNGNFAVLIAIILGYVILSLMRDGRQFGRYLMRKFGAETVPASTQTTDSVLTNGTVYFSQGGECYHYKKDCRGLNYAHAVYPRRLCLHCAAL
jgi:hypothetical protein